VLESERGQPSLSNVSVREQGSTANAEISSVIEVRDKQPFAVVKFGAQALPDRRKAEGADQLPLASDLGERHGRFKTVPPLQTAVRGRFHTADANMRLARYSRQRPRPMNAINPITPTVIRALSKNLRHGTKRRGA